MADSNPFEKRKRADRKRQSLPNCSMRSKGRSSASAAMMMVMGVLSVRLRLSAPPNSRRALGGAR